MEYGSCVASDVGVASGVTPRPMGTLCSPRAFHEQALLQKILPRTKQKTSVAKEAVMLPAMAAQLWLDPSQFARSCRQSLTRS